MPHISHRSLAAASVLALASLPVDRGLFRPACDVVPPPKPCGHERLPAEGGFCHLVDWDPWPGIDAIVHEQGIRTGPLWSEFRKWRREHRGVDIVTAGNKACELLTKHFGGFNETIAESLVQRRALETTKLLMQAKLDREYPPLVRIAARRFIQYGESSPNQLTASPNSHLLEPGEVSAQWSKTVGMESVTLAPPSSTPHSEEIVREYMLKNPDLKRCSSIREVARNIVSEVASQESELEVMDESIRSILLPDIPGETYPADMDRLAFGSLVCRHRAVIVGVLLADAGYHVELVLGRVSRLSGSERHLFIYSDSAGILESSCEGPEFWKETISETKRNGKLSITIEGGLTYEFERRTTLLHDYAR